MDSNSRHYCDRQQVILSQEYLDKELYQIDLHVISNFKGHYLFIIDKPQGLEFRGFVIRGLVDK